LKPFSAILNSTPGYLDVSIDGNEATHDAIRGKGMFEKTVMNIKALPDSLKEKVFISFTLNRVTAPGMEEMISQLTKIGISHFLISPYATIQDVQYDHLWMPAPEMAQVVHRMTENVKIPGVSIYVKSDYDTSRDFMDALVGLRLIDLENLLVDEYGVVFSLHEKNGQKFYFNWYGMSTTIIKDIRISHDGFVGSCLDMFFKDYPLRAIGNVSDAKITDILKRKF
jgi:MoaA/NifB/PqqE/SkfB family radical SAM enzyme